MSMIPGWLKICLLVLFGVMCFEFGHSIAETKAELTASNLENTRKDQEKDQKEKDEAERIEREKSYENEITRLSGELQKKKDENQTLADNVATGSTKLYIPVKCPSPRVVRSTDTTSRVEDSRAELDPASRQDYFALRNQVIATEDQLSKCLAFVRKNTTQ